MSARHTWSELDFCCHHHKGQHSDPFPNVPRKERKDQQLYRLTQLSQDGAVECSVHQEEKNGGHSTTVQVNCESLAIRIQKLNLSLSSCKEPGTYAVSFSGPALNRPLDNTV